MRLDPARIAALKALAAKEGVTVGTLIRRGVDAVLLHRPTAPDDGKRYL